MNELFDLQDAAAAIVAGPVAGWLLPLAIALAVLAWALKSSDETP